VAVCGGIQLEVHLSIPFESGQTTDHAGRSRGKEGKTVGEGAGEAEGDSVSETSDGPSSYLGSVMRKRGEYTLSRQRGKNVGGYDG